MKLKAILKMISAVLVLSAGLLSAGLFPACAAGSQSINTVSFRISAKLKPGDELPPVRVGGGSSVSEGEVDVTEVGSVYYVSSAQWVTKTSKGLQTGDAPKLNVTLDSYDISEYYFLSAYKSGKISVGGGTFISAKRSGNSLIVTVTLNPVKGKYDCPEEIYWNDKNLGEAKWKGSVNSSGHFEIQLLRDNKTVGRIEDTTANSYNFYPYMTQRGEYTLKIRCIASTAEQKKYGSSSDWTVSGGLNITDRYTSDGKGAASNEKASSLKQGTSQKIGWDKSGSSWVHREPSGKLATGWKLIDDKWYYFDRDGLMQTGRREINGCTYYLYDSGEMARGWVKAGDGKWYYLRQKEEGGMPEGSMLSDGWRVIGNQYYYFNADGSMYKGWLNKDGSWYYLNEVENSMEGAMFTGWINRNSKSYYTDSNGRMLEGWWEIDNEWYYFYPGSGELARDTYVEGQYINHDGVLQN